MAITKQCSVEDASWKGAWKRHNDDGDPGDDVPKRVRAMALRRKGLSLRAIGERIGVSYETVRRLLVEQTEIEKGGG